MAYRKNPNPTRRSEPTFMRDLRRDLANNFSNSDKIGRDVHFTIYSSVSHLVPTLPTITVHDDYFKKPNLPSVRYVKGEESEIISRVAEEVDNLNKKLDIIGKHYVDLFNKTGKAFIYQKSINVYYAPDSNNPSFYATFRATNQPIHTKIVAELRVLPVLDDVGVHYSEINKLKIPKELIIRADPKAAYEDDPLSNVYDTPPKKLNQENYQEAFDEYKIYCTAVGSLIDLCDQTMKKLLDNKNNLYMLRPKEHKNIKANPFDYETESNKRLEGQLPYKLPLISVVSRLKEIFYKLSVAHLQAIKNGMLKIGQAPTSQLAYASLPTHEDIKNTLDLFYTLTAQYSAAHERISPEDLTISRRFGFFYDGYSKYIDYANNHFDLSKILDPVLSESLVEDAVALVFFRHLYWSMHQLINELASALSSTLTANGVGDGSGTSYGYEMSNIIRWLIYAGVPPEEINKKFEESFATLNLGTGKTESEALDKFLKKIGMPVDIENTKAANRKISARLKTLAQTVSEKYNIEYSSDPAEVVLTALRRSDDIDEIMLDVITAVEDCINLAAGA
jgi:hypothetical protein